MPPNTTNWIFFILLWIFLNGINCDEKNTCLDRTSSNILRFSCNNEEFIHIQQVQLAKTLTAVCSVPNKNESQCVQSVPAELDTLVRECGTFSSCFKFITFIDADKCGAEFQGAVFLSVEFECLPRKMGDGQDISYVDMGTSRSESTPHSTAYLISQDYPTMKSINRSVCRLRSSQPSTGQTIALKVMDFSTDADSSAECAYKLLIIDALGSSMVTWTYCAHNVSAALTLEGGGGQSSDAGMAQVAFLQKDSQAKGRLWLKITVFEADGNESPTGISIDCSPTMNLLTYVTTTTLSTPSTTTKTSSTTAAPTTSLPDKDVTEKVVEDEVTDEDDAEKSNFWIYVGAGVGGGLLVLIIIIVITAMCYSKTGDNNQTTIKSTDLIDAWDDSSNLGKLRVDSKKKKAKPQNLTPPNMCANIYADIPSHKPPPPPRQYNGGGTVRSGHSGYSTASDDRLWDPASGNRREYSRQQSVDSAGSGFANGGYGSRKSSVATDYSRQQSNQSSHTTTATLPHDYMRQYSGQSTTTTLPLNYSRQASNQSQASSGFQNGGPYGNGGGFQTMPHPNRSHQHPQQKNKVPGPPTYAKPKIPKRTTSLEKVNTVSQPDNYESPQTMNSSQLSLYGYSTSLPE